MSGLSDDWRGMYVERRDGVIVGVYANPQPGIAEEPLAEDDAELVAFLNPGPTLDDIVAERARRMALGFDYDFGDDRGVHRIGTTDQDMAGWREVTDLANARLAEGAADTPIQIVTDTGPATVTPVEWSRILIAAGEFRQPLWAASFILQTMDPIPADYADDGYWQSP